MGAFAWFVMSPRHVREAPAAPEANEADSESGRQAAAAGEVNSNLKSACGSRSSIAINLPLVVTRCDQYRGQRDRGPVRPHRGTGWERWEGGSNFADLVESIVIEIGKKLKCVCWSRA